MRNNVDGVFVTEVAEPGGDGPLVEVAACGICGTDLGYLAMGPMPFTLGHEIAGTVDGVPYAIEPHTPCGACDACTSGNGNRCFSPVNRRFGNDCDGGLAELLRVPASCLVPLPSGLALDDASLVETTAVAYRGVRLSQAVPGQKLCILGGGAIGLAAVGVARHRGLDVEIEARHPHQRSIAERLGARVAPGGAQSRYDVVIEAAGSEAAIARAVELIRPGGRIVLLGVYHSVMPLPGIPMLCKEATVLASMAYGEDPQGGREYANAAQVLAANPEMARSLITHRFALADAAEAFRVAADRASGAVKVVIHPNS